MKTRCSQIERYYAMFTRFYGSESENRVQHQLFSGVEKLSDHGTIGPRKFFGIPENIQDSVAEEENDKQIFTKAK